MPDETRFARVFPAFSEEELLKLGRPQTWLVLLGEKETYCSEDDSKEIAEERAKVINTAFEKALSEHVKAEVEKEREKCAKIADEARPEVSIMSPYKDKVANVVGWDISRTIRARGRK